MARSEAECGVPSLVLASARTRIRGEVRPRRGALPATTPALKLFPPRRAISARRPVHAKPKNDREVRSPRPSSRSYSHGRQVRPASQPAVLTVFPRRSKRWEESDIDIVYVYSVRAVHPRAFVFSLFLFWVR